MRTRTEKRRAFTLVEMLVVVAIIGILISITVPAVNGARESARNAICKSNLHNIMVGLEAHHSQYGCYPPGLPSCVPKANQTWSGGDRNGKGDEGGWCEGPNWAMALLGFMGYKQNADLLRKCMDNKINAADECSHEYNDYGDLGQHQFEWLLCPSAPTMRLKFGFCKVDKGWSPICDLPEDLEKKGRGMDKQLANQEVLAKGNYAANFGAGTYREAVVSENAVTERERSRVRGAFQVHTLQGASARKAMGSKSESDFWGRWKMGSTIGIRKDAMRDGLSHTLMVSEVIGWDSKMDIRGSWASASPGAATFTGYLPPNSTVYFDDSGNPKSGQDHILVCGTVHSDDSLKSPKIPSGHELSCTENQSGDGAVYAAARSAHPGGVNALFADSAVRFVEDSVEPLVWQALCTRAAGPVEYNNENLTMPW